MPAVDPSLNRDVCPSFVLQCSLLGVVTIRSREGLFDVDGMRRMALNQVGVVATPSGRLRRNPADALTSSSARSLKDLRCREPSERRRGSMDSGVSPRSLTGSMSALSSAVSAAFYAGTRGHQGSPSLIGML
jgi:hypothetical protein